MTELSDKLKLHRKESEVLCGIKNAPRFVEYVPFWDASRLILGSLIH